MCASWLIFAIHRGGSAEVDVLYIVHPVVY